MTEENRKKNIALEIQRGQESLKAADVLLAAGLFADAVSRAYYAAFHYARALLLTLGEEPRTHAGVERLIQRDFVRAGNFDPEVASLFSRLHAHCSNGAPGRPNNKGPRWSPLGVHLEAATCEGCSDALGPGHAMSPRVCFSSASSDLYPLCSFHVQRHTYKLL